MKETLHKRMLTFLYSVLESPNEIVSYIGKLALPSAKSPMGKNMSYFKYKFGIVFNNSLQMSMTSLRKVYTLNELQYHNASIGIELRDMRDEVRCFFTKYEIDDMYSYICTT